MKSLRPWIAALLASSAASAADPVAWTESFDEDAGWMAGWQFLDGGCGTTGLRCSLGLGASRLGAPTRGGGGALRFSDGDPGPVAGGSGGEPGPRLRRPLGVDGGSAAVRFWFYLEDAGFRPRYLSPLLLTSTRFYFLELTQDRGAWQGSRKRQDAGFISLPVSADAGQPLTDAWHVVEVRVDGMGSPDGSVRAFIDEQVATLSGESFVGEVADQLELGAAWVATSNNESFTGNATVDSLMVGPGPLPSVLELRPVDGGVRRVDGGACIRVRLHLLDVERKVAVSHAGVPLGSSEAILLDHDAGTLHPSTSCVGPDSPSINLAPGTDVRELSALLPHDGRVRLRAESSLYLGDSVELIAPPRPPDPPGGDAGQDAGDAEDAGDGSRELVQRSLFAIGCATTPEPLGFGLCVFFGLLAIALLRRAKG